MPRSPLPNSLRDLSSLNGQAGDNSIMNKGGTESK